MKVIRKGGHSICTVFLFGTQSKRHRYVVGTSEIVPRYTLSSSRYVFITFQHSCPIEAHSDVVESFPLLLVKVRQTDPRNEYRGAEEPL